MVEIAPERIELLVPEVFVAGHPRRSGVHRCGVELAAHDTPFLGAGDEAGGLQHGEVLHEPRQRHAMWLSKLADGCAALAQLLEHATPRGVGQRGEHEVEAAVLSVNHKV